MRNRRFLPGFLLFLCLLIAACVPAAALTAPHPSSATLVSTATIPSIPSATRLPSPTPSPSSNATTLVRLPTTSATPQAETIHVARDISYAQIAGVDPRLLSLDVYYTDPISAKRPVMLFIHGGGWIGGDKDHVAIKSEFFTQAGFVFISANYRLSPQAIFPAHVQDVAKAIAWTLKGIGQYGGDPARLFLMGHSAGGQLVTLVATDDQYLKSFGLSLSVIKGVVSLDTAAYDIPYFASLCKNQVLPQPYSIPFGQNPTEWKYASPITYIQSGKHIPPIAVIYSGDLAIGSNVTRRLLSEEFDRKLVAAGVVNELFGAPEKSHAAINDDFGKPGDAVSLQALAFLKKIK
jgi:arylformamidase